MYRLAALDRSRYSKLSSRQIRSRTQNKNISLNVTLLTLAFLFWIEEDKVTEAVHVMILH